MNSQMDSIDSTCTNGGVTVLIVEDEPLVLDMISQELTDQGFAVVEADTAEVALSIIKSGQVVDVLFTDIHLPGDMNGWQLAETVREAKPTLPVIYATGYPVVTTPEGRPLGQVPDSVFLKKPYRPATIAEKIRTLIAAPIVGSN